MLVAHQINKAYAGKAVLKNVSLHVDAGETLSLLGPSGCGKSTLLRILANLEPADKGTLKASQEALGYLPQSRALLPWRNLKQNVALGMEYQSKSVEEIDTAVTYLLKQVALSDDEALYPNQMSGGMIRRAALLQVLATNPKVLLLDEPLTGLDVNGRRSVSKLIRNYVATKQGAAVVVTHSIEEAVYMSDRVIVFSSSANQAPGALRITDENRKQAFADILSHFDALDRSSHV